MKNRTSVLDRAFAQLDDVDKEKHWLQARWTQLEAWVHANMETPSQAGRLQICLDEMADITAQLTRLAWGVVDTSVEAA